MQRLIRSNKKTVILATALVVILSLSWVISRSARDRGAPVDFSTEVKPLLNKHCISCHGGVKAKGGFSVLFEEEAFSPTESGKPAIIKGDPDASEMIRRLTLDDPEERMPYEHDPLSQEEIALLRRWIKQGAPWGDHWAYLPVKQPDEKRTIDQHIQRELEKQGLEGSKRAEAPVLLRRVSLDLIGLYPEKEQVEKFLKADGSPAAYEELVDSLLASPRFGEKWASMWLDLARYADTKGYESDGHRDAWPYRDWVIKAFNRNMPYDQFIKEQMAGDLLPNPTDDNYIATGFHRNSMTNDEGGTDNEEFRVAAVMDRINTSWEAIMSTTFSCVQCHSHPYDPFKHDEYYKFLAYFNNTRDEDVPGEYPLLRRLTPDMEQELDYVMGWMEAGKKGGKENGGKEEGEWVREMIKFYQPAVNSTTADQLDNAVIGNMNYALIFKNKSTARFKNIDLEGAEQMIWQFYCNKPGGTLTLRLDAPDGPVIAKAPVQAKDQWRFESISFTKQQGVHDLYIQYERTPLATEKDDFTITFNWLSFVPAFPGKDRPGYATAYQRYWKLLSTYVPGMPVLYENPASLNRTTQVFERGNRLTPGAEVKPAVPASLLHNMQLKETDMPKNRLELADWMTNPRNPLVSRTLVNRLWEQLFGTGLVETLEDMGTQGANPTHHQLLDELSWKLMHDYQWNLKKILKEMVLSATYQQDSRVSKEQLEKDAANKYYARGPRIRLSAEQLRDQHLQVSGKLSTKMYGPGVMPWQPDGIWLSPYNGARWTMSEGEDRYRRAVYTYWKRTAPYPSMINFDGAQRVVCNARRIRTNTPLQALVTLNDSVYVDLAAHFAIRMENADKGDEGGNGDGREHGSVGKGGKENGGKEERKRGGRKTEERGMESHKVNSGKLDENYAGSNNVEEMVKWGYRQLLFSEIKEEQLKAMLELYAKARRTYEANPKELKAFGQPSPHAAAMVVVANALLNLDEVIVKN